MQIPYSLIYLCIVRSSINGDLMQSHTGLADQVVEKKRKKINLVRACGVKGERQGERERELTHCSNSRAIRI